MPSSKGRFEADLPDFLPARRRPVPLSAGRALLILAVVLVLGSLWRLLALRQLLAGGLDLAVDEAQYWSWAQALAWGYYSKPPGIAALIAATTALFGDSELAVKSGALLLYPLTTLVLFALALRMYGPRVALWTGVVFFTLPGVAFSGLIVSTDVPLFLCWSAALYAFWEALRTGRWGWWLGLGVAAGLGLLTKYTMGLFLLSALLYTAGTPAARAALRTPKPWAAMAVAALLWLPNLVWNARHGWPTFRHTGDLSNLAEPGLRFSDLLGFFGAQLAVLGPLLFVALVVRAVQPKLWWTSQRERFLAAFTLPFLLVIAMQALLGGAHANWGAMAYAAGTLWLVSGLLARQRRWLLQASLVLHLLMTALAYHYPALMHGAEIPLAAKASAGECWRALAGHDAGAHCPDPYRRARGWQALGAAVAARLEERPGTLLLTDERDAHAELAYYARPRSADAVAWHPSGAARQHFELVTSLEGKGNRDFLFVRRDEALPPGLAESFVGATELGAVEVPVARGHTLRYRLARLDGYMGLPLWLEKGLAAPPAESLLKPRAAPPMP